MRKPVGLFITGTDTDVGKTHVAAMIARSVASQGVRRRSRGARKSCRKRYGRYDSRGRLAEKNDWGAASQGGAAAARSATGRSTR